MLSYLVEMSIPLLTDLGYSYTMWPYPQLGAKEVVELDGET